MPRRGHIWHGKLHKRYVRFIDKDGEVSYYKRSPRDCPGCQPKCVACGEPYTVSTADNTQHFCSLSCEAKHNQEPPIERPRRWRKGGPNGSKHFNERRP